MESASCSNGHPRGKAGGFLLLGAGGQLGSDLARVLAGPSLVALTHGDLDVTDPAAVERAIASTEFARRIFELCGLRPDLAPTTSEAFGAPARRPAHSVLANVRLAPLRPWPEALHAYLKAKGHLV